MVGWRDSVWALWLRLFHSQFLRNTSLLAFASLFERGCALLQTVLIARAVGRYEYGVYGLLFSTLGFVASVAGLQMGLTGTVLLARYLAQDKAKAVAVLKYIANFTWISALGLAFLAFPFAQELSIWLFKTDGYMAVLRISGLLVGLGMVVGVQGGILQGFEDFRAVAISQALGTLVPVLLVYPAGVWFGLLGVVWVLLFGVLLRLAYGSWAVYQNRLRHGLFLRGEGVSFGEVVWGVSIPSMLVSFLVGLGMWFGAYLLTRQASGFEGMASVNVGQQWRGPILFFAMTATTVALPRIGRYHALKDEASSKAFSRKMLWASGIFSSVLCGLIVLFSPWILSLYGSDFLMGQNIFVLFVLGVVPSLLAHVGFQEYLAKGLLWQVFWMHIPAYIVQVLCCVLLIPTYKGVGYSLSLLCSSLVLCLTLWWVSYWKVEKESPPSTPIRDEVPSSTET